MKQQQPPLINYEELISNITKHLKYEIKSELLKELGYIEKEFYSIKEVSYITGITIDGLKQRRRRGKIKMVTEGGFILMHKDELYRFLKELKRPLLN